MGFGKVGEFHAAFAETAAIEATGAEGELGDPLLEIHFVMAFVEEGFDAGEAVRDGEDSGGGETDAGDEDGGEMEDAGAGGEHDGEGDDAGQDGVTEITLKPEGDEDGGEDKEREKGAVKELAGGGLVFGEPSGEGDDESDFSEFGGLAADSEPAAGAVDLATGHIPEAGDHGEESECQQPPPGVVEALVVHVGAENEEPDAEKEPANLAPNVFIGFSAAFVSFQIEICAC